MRALRTNGLARGKLDRIRWRVELRGLEPLANQFTAARSHLASPTEGREYPNPDFGEGPEDWGLRPFRMWAQRVLSEQKNGGLRRLIDEPSRVLRPAGPVIAVAASVVDLRDHWPGCGNGVGKNRKIFEARLFRSAPIVLYTDGKSS